MNKNEKTKVTRIVARMILAYKGSIPASACKGPQEAEDFTRFYVVLVGEDVNMRALLRVLLPGADWEALALTLQRRRSQMVGGGS